MGRRGRDGGRRRMDRQKAQKTLSLMVARNDDIEWSVIVTSCSGEGAKHQQGWQWCREEGGREKRSNLT